ncbi:MAG: UDP-N-acetylmuramate dehydrogenase [Patescibacteria group bacterium]|nr:UDP-N-acetylmuramate dehydrogenase [Patescibacteria group bacterium]MDD5295011.1 UDP-N-acetylmuramate dehydrogenase [Patescibacteria group bacterium]MDD5554199.1 UDP-N-acetylmuramate dehydrogenase [Patescibacteria group bacterium]
MDKIQENIPLAQFTTFRIGGPAKFFIEVKEKDDLSEAIKWAKENKEKFYILGGGSNIIINDKGVDGLVVRMANDNIKIHGERMETQAGAVLARAVRLAMGDNLSGLEWAAGIPRATIGGAVRGNAGAFGSSMNDIVETIEVFNIKKGKFELFSHKDCCFDYRESVFKKDNNYLIWNAVLKLAKGNKKEIESAVNKFLESRQNRQPKLPSAGSVFKNLPIDYLKENNANIADLANQAGVIKDGKVGAGWLIELAGLKGKKIGGAKVSLEHANFIVNTSQATAEDIIMLISYIKQQVRNRFNIQLQEEVQYLGF